MGEANFYYFTCLNDIMKFQRYYTRTFDSSETDSDLSLTLTNNFEFDLLLSTLFQDELV